MTEAEETQPCLSCLTPNPRLRRAVEAPKNRLVLAGILAYAGSIAAAGLVLVLATGPGVNLGWWGGLAMGLFATALGARTMWRWHRKPH